MVCFATRFHCTGATIDTPASVSLARMHPWLDGAVKRALAPIHARARLRFRVRVRLSVGARVRVSVRVWVRVRVGMRVKLGSG